MSFDPPPLDAKRLAWGGAVSAPQATKSLFQILFERLFK